jgi:TonB family protein
LTKRVAILAAGASMLCCGPYAGADATGDQGPAVEVMQAVAPEYPEAACAAQVEGRVKVEVTSLPGGGLGETRAEGIPLLQAAAVPAALGWRFGPHGESRKVELTFVFRLIREADGVNTKTSTLFRPPYEVEIQCRPFWRGATPEPRGKKR